MSDIEIKEKAPDDRLDYDFDFKRLGWLEPTDSIVSATVSISTISGSASPALIDGQDLTATRVKVWVKGGVDGEDYTVKAIATTAEGRQKEACFRLRIREECQ